MKNTQNRKAKTIINAIVEKGLTTPAEIDTLRELVTTGGGGRRLIEQITELEELLINCATRFSPIAEEKHGIRQKAKEIAEFLKEAAGKMTRDQRIAFTGKNQSPTTQLNRIGKAQRTRNQRPLGKIE
jgi:uncharacterized protein YjbJ (UPF0337 family)